jgi:hypothetical protein
MLISAPCSSKIDGNGLLVFSLRYFSEVFVRGKREVLKRVLRLLTSALSSLAVPEPGTEKRCARGQKKIVYIVEVKLSDNRGNSNSPMIDKPPGLGWPN